MATRGLWKGSISFGLLNIPVVLQTAEEGRDLHFKMLDKKNLSPIKYLKINAKTGKEVPYQQIVKGYEFEPGQFVTFTQEDIKAANPKATQTIDIEDFVDLEDIDTLLFEKPYYVVPQKSGAKGYALLRDALHKAKKVAVGRIVLRTKQHLAAIMPKDQFLILEMLRFAHEVKEVNEAEYLETKKKANARPYSPRELAMAQSLIDGMTSPWRPEKYKDTYYDDVMRAIQQKIKTGKVTQIETDADGESVAVSNANVVDLLPLLKKSLATHARGRKKEKGRPRVHH